MANPPSQRFIGRESDLSANRLVHRSSQPHGPGRGQARKKAAGKYPAANRAQNFFELKCRGVPGMVELIAPRNYCGVENLVPSRERSEERRVGKECRSRW